MRSILLAIVLPAVVLMQSASQAAEPLRVMSFNIRYGAADDGENRWELRKEMVVDVINEFSPDLLGLQEALAFQSDYIGSKLDGYQYFGRSRMTTPNEHCGIFVKVDRFVQLAGGHFWLSESPEVPASKSWDSSLPRMATWLLLQDQQRLEGPPVLIVNTHFDHRGKKARQKSAQLLAERVGQLRQLADNPIVIVTGDFNTAVASGPYTALLAEEHNLSDRYRVVHPNRAAEEGTFDSWTGETEGAR